MALSKDPRTGATVGTTTSVTDPYWKMRQLDQMAQMAAMFGDLKQKRKERERKKRMEDLQTQVQVWADTGSSPAGRDRILGSQAMQWMKEHEPKTADTFDYILNNKEAELAGKLQREYNSAAAAAFEAARTPTSLPTLPGVGGGAPPSPGLTYPGSTPEIMGQLDPAQQMALQLGPTGSTKQGVPPGVMGQVPPFEFDKLTPSMYGRLMEALGALPPEMRDAILMSTGEKLTAGEKMRGAQEESRQEIAKDNLELKNRSQDRLVEKLGLDVRKFEAELSGALPTGKKVNYGRVLGAESSRARREWQKTYNKSPDKKWWRRHNPPPAVIPKEIAGAMGRDIKAKIAAGKMLEDEVPGLMRLLMEKYDELVKSGLSPTEAWATIQESPQAPTSIGGV